MKREIQVKDFGLLLKVFAIQIPEKIVQFLGLQDKKNDKFSVSNGTKTASSEAGTTAHLKIPIDHITASPVAGVWPT